MSSIDQNPAAGGPTRATTASDLRPGQATAGETSLTDTIRDGAASGAAQAKEQARQMAHQAREQTAEMATQQKQLAASQLQGVAGAIRSAADNLAEHDQAMMAGYVRQAASSLDQVATNLQDRSVGELVEGVEQFARRQPAAFIGGAMMAGFALARFAKASADRHHAATTTSNGGPAYGRHEAGDRPRATRSAGQSGGAPSDRTGIANPELYTHYGAGRPDATPAQGSDYNPASGGEEAKR